MGVSVAKFYLNRKFVFLLTSFLCLSTVGVGSSDFQYPVVFFVFLLFFFIYGRFHLEIIVFWAFIIFLIWVYGVFVGVINSNDPLAVFRNFAGMVLYLPFALIISASRINFKEILEILNKCSFLYTPIAMYFMLANLGSFMGSDMFDSIGVSAFRLYYSVGILIYFPLIAVSLYQFFFKESFFLNLKLYCNSFFGVLFLLASASKGFILSFFFVVLIVIFSSVIKKIKCFRLNFRQFFFLLILIIFIISIMPSLISIIQILVDLETDPMHPRVVQSTELINSFSIFGIGLGGTLDSGYTRDAMGYGMELTYHAIISKFGIIFGTLLIIAVVFPLLLSVFRLLKSPEPRHAFSLGCSAYLIAAWGNPLIFAPLMVLMSCFAFKFSLGKYGKFFYER